MRRIFILAILLLLSVQATWAVTNNYCEHESGTAAQHIGHHAHQHDKVDAESKITSSSAVDNDCASCDLGGFGIMPVSATAGLFNAMLPAQEFVTSSLLPSACTERPERPKWIRAV